MLRRTGYCGCECAETARLTRASCPRALRGGALPRPEWKGPLTHMTSYRSPQSKRRRGVVPTGNAERCQSGHDSDSSLTGSSSVGACVRRCADALEPPKKLCRKNLWQGKSLSQAAFYDIHLWTFVFTTCLPVLVRVNRSNGCLRATQIPNRRLHFPRTSNTSSAVACLPTEWHACPSLVPLWDLPPADPHPRQRCSVHTRAARMAPIPRRPCRRLSIALVFLGALLTLARLMATVLSPPSGEGDPPPWLSAPQAPVRVPPQVARGLHESPKAPPPHTEVPSQARQAHTTAQPAPTTPPVSPRGPAPVPAGQAETSLVKPSRGAVLSGLDPPYPKRHEVRLDSDLVAMCKRLLWNARDTCVRILPKTHPEYKNGPVFVITGDIDDMWLRDSAAQVNPYIPLTRTDPHLREIVEGLILRQAFYIMYDPYANAFRIDTSYVFSENQRAMGRHGYISTWDYELDSGECPVYSSPPTCPRLWGWHGGDALMWTMASHICIHTLGKAWKPTNELTLSNVPRLPTQSRLLLYETHLSLLEGEQRSSSCSLARRGKEKDHECRPTHG